MIYKIADAPPGGKGLVGIYPDWDGTGEEDAFILSKMVADHFIILFSRNYYSQFLQRIAAHLRCYGNMVDILCGWDEEKLRMSFFVYNPEVEVFSLSAMHFNTFEILRAIRHEAITNQLTKDNDLFFATSERPDGLKNTALLVKLLSLTQLRLRVIGYGRLSEQDLQRIRSNQMLDFTWRGKSAVMDTAQRKVFLRDLRRSRILLVTSTMEGYCRLIGEALYLGVPALLPSGICCDNWVHLNVGNCRLFLESTFDQCLADMLLTRWRFAPPSFSDGNKTLKMLFNEYLSRRKLPEPSVWHPLQYGALNDNIIRRETL